MASISRLPRLALATRSSPNQLLIFPCGPFIIQSLIWCAPHTLACVLRMGVHILLHMHMHALRLHAQCARCTAFVHAHLCACTKRALCTERTRYKLDGPAQTLAYLADAQMKLMGFTLL